FCFRPSMAGSIPKCSPSGCWRIACRRDCSCSSTNTSGRRKREASEVPMRAVILLSGGLDSYTAAAIARSEGFELYALTVAYGQRHSRELESARAVARDLGVVRHLELAVDLRAIGGSSLTSETAVPRKRDLSAPSETPSTYVPARNTILLALALGWAEV